MIQSPCYRMQGICTLTLAFGILFCTEVLAPENIHSALVGDHNIQPELCQGIAGAAYSVNVATSLFSPPPIDSVADVLAYVANLNLKLCQPQIQAPAGIFGVEPDSRNQCVHTFSQPTTKAEYQNILGAPIPIKYPTDWGELGRPKTYHFNSDAQVRLLGYEDESGSIALPVGRNTLTWRADTMVSVMDFVPFHLPKLPSGTKAQKAVVKSTPVLREAAEAGFKAYARTIGKKAAEFIVEEGVSFGIDQVIDKSWRHSQLGVFDDIYTSDTQSVWIYDHIPPVISTNTDSSLFSEEIAAILDYDASQQTYIVEAFQPGGVNAQSILPVAEGLLSYSDACNTKLTLSHGPVPALWSIGDEVTVTWTVRDPGPVRRPVLVEGVPQDSGGFNSASVTQTFRVQDTNPPVLLAPPSKVIEVVVGTSGVEVSLGSPRVFDLVDLDADIAHDQPDTQFELGLTEITWTATDDGGNESQAVQLVNIKEEGTNSVPEAYSQVIDAISFTPVDIILTGGDTDYHSSVDRYDPLTFSIAEPPQNGFFIAPLLPFFIEDYRLEAATLGFEYDINNPDQSMQVDPDQACVDGLTGGGHWDLRYPYRPDWMTVDDAGKTFVFDFGDTSCEAGGQYAEFDERLAMFDSNGEFVRSRQMSDDVRDIYVDNFSGRLLILEVVGVAYGGYVNAYDKEAENFGVPPGTTASGVRLDNIQSPRAIVEDHQGVLYVLETPGHITAHKVDWTIFGTNQDDDETKLADIPDVPTSINVYDLTVDSMNNLYLPVRNRIYKYSAGSFNENGEFTPPQLVGWMGRCLSNLTNTVACDINNQRSIGFSCTDGLCERDMSGYDGGGPDRGQEPGQFAGPQAVVVDPNDILYVGDAGNDRIQRFTQDGYFAGQARSQGQGYGFILGDFGDFDTITVNSNNFYLLQKQDPLGGTQGLLHVFKTTPITPIDDASARVTYQSNNNFQGLDNFVFEVTDGLDNDQATVTINVERDYRPPSIPHPPPIQTVEEDGSVTITLTASDPDEHLDTLTYSISKPPLNGKTELTGDQLVYTPNDNFAGNDSLSYTVSDGRFEAEPATVMITVTPVADAPEVTLSVAEHAGTGFILPLDVTVFDPDTDADHDITILWGDGADERSGEILVNGAPSDGPLLDDDGTLPDDIETTGPIYSRGLNGYGSMSSTHSYLNSGSYNIYVCAVDKVMTPASTGCAEATVVVSPRVAYLLENEVSAEEVKPGDRVGITVTLTNRVFDAEPEDGTQGIDDTGVVVTGFTSAGLTGLRHRATVGASTSSSPVLCTFNDKNYRCELGNMPYNSSVDIVFEVDVEALAPGLALLSLSTEVKGSAPVHQQTTGVAQLMVIARDAPPQLVSVTPDSGDNDSSVQVTLKGADFQAGAAVYFGNRYANLVDVVNAKTISAQAPIQASGSVDVVVINPDERSDRLAKAFTYEEPNTGGGPGSSTMNVLFFMPAITSGAKNK